MKNIHIILFSAIMMAASVSAQAQPNSKLRPDMTVFLYQEKPVEIQDPVQGKKTEALGLDIAVSNGLTGDENISESGNIGNISENARFDLYFPKKPNGQMVIVCPGGGYVFVSSYNEGVYVADWMLSQGITVAVVKYRLPDGHWEVPLTDVQNTFRYCREHASEWGVKQIGVMGFSAGGHLAASATTLYTDEVTRPDFSILIYPVTAMDEITPSHQGSKVNLLGKAEKWKSYENKTAEQYLNDLETYSRLTKKYSSYMNITPETPPVFLAHCTDDKTVHVINSIVFYENLVKNGVSAEMHIWPKGGHGWGFSSAKFVKKDNLGYARDEFETSLGRWLESVRE